MFCRKI